MTSTTTLAPPVRAATGRATLIGVSAILMWALLAPLTALTGTLPPFQTVAVAFAIGGLTGICGTLAGGRSPLRAMRQPLAAWGLSVGGLFGFHFLYFLSLKSAPPVEANLINYLWPLFIVLFSALLPGERLRWWHVAGAMAGLAGTVLLVTRGGGVAIERAYVAGYVAALGSALIWTTYSLLNRRFGQVPTDAVAGFCLATAALALLCHLAWEVTVWPDGIVGWLALVGLGIGPVGAAFFAWDHGVKRGDIRALGAISYASPLLSTLLLIGFGLAPGHWTVWAACGLIVGGAVLASWEVFRRG
ncbi:membrane protein [Skermanella stibiiresistens SB22]|uniref:Membrane protein n=1 Tax=Skermanella stibiiresistens SB22 TaxID=1385369 RepID=W9HDB2_9PROT|nr:EamA family transporter [Skermanella stibiiresistens]EWY42667.1 membrane protein [Skermanella stibiiresistens SB22]